MPTAEKMEYLSTRTLLALCGILPETAVYGLFSLFGRAFYHLAAGRRRLTLRNLEIAFPEMESRERKSLAKRVYRNLSESLAFSSLMLGGRISDEKIAACVDCPSLDQLRKISEGSETGIVFLSAHLGNWELMAHYIHLQLGGTNHVIARESDNKLIDERILTPFRSQSGLKVIYKRQAMLKMVKALKRGENIGILVDQKSNTIEGVPVRFFGRELQAVAAPAVLQIRFGVPVVPVFMVRTGRRQYLLEIGAPVEWSGGGLSEEDQIEKLTQCHQGIIEDAIRRWPDQWFWMHNRWKLPKQ